jgi:hypothetical protein
MVGMIPEEALLTTLEIMHKSKTLTINNMEYKIVYSSFKMFQHRNIHNTWTSPDGRTHNQIDHILIDRRWHSSILHVQSFRAADCDTDHYLVVAKVREKNWQ